MKRIAYILMAAAVVFAACTKEEFEHPTEAGVKNAASYNPTVTVDQELNQVTFSLGEQSVIPVWVLQDNDGEWTSYNARDNFRKIFVASGDYKVRMYVMNASGISPDYVEKSFRIDNTLIDFTKYYKYISGGESRVWRINNDEPAHMACGPAVDNATEWWSAGADEKAAFGVYANRLTFTSDKAYTFDPGDAGTVYVNVGVTKAPYAESGHDSDYQVAQSKVSSTYEFAVDGNDLKLALPAGTPFPYIPNDDYMADSRFYLQSLTNKEMVLVWYTPTGNGGGSIAWQYILTSSEASVKEDPLFGTGSKVWKMANELSGHMACGPDAGNPTGWWSAGANEKADYGVYDNRLTFAADGTYTFDPGDDGLIYVNWGCATVDGQTHSEPDFTLAWQKQEGRYSYDGENITLPANFTIGYIPNDACYANPSFIITELTADKMVLVSETEGIAWQFIFIPADGSGTPENPETPEEGAHYDITGATNLWRNMTYTMSFYTAHGSAWEGLPDTGFEADDANFVYHVTMPEATDNQWQRQVAFHTTMSSSADKKYDFCCTVIPTDDLPGVTIKLVLDGGGENDNVFYFADRHDMKADEPFVYKMPNMPGIDMDRIALFFDFGGNPAGAEATIRDICFQEHQEPHGGSQEPAFDYNSDRNLWKPVDAEGGHTYSQYYATGSSWDQLPNPEITQSGNSYSFNLPTETMNQWQAQFFVIPTEATAISLSAEKFYDFRVKITTSEDHPSITLKLTDATDDGNFLFTNQVQTSADKEGVFAFTNLPGIDAAAVKMVFDFGGNVADTDVTISEIILQEHVEGADPGPGPGPEKDYTTNDPSVDDGIFDIEGSRNLWRKAYITNSYWYSGPNWDGLLEPIVFNEDDWGGLKVIVPEGIGGSEWQGQTVWHTDIPASADKTYDFRFKMKSDEDIYGFTVKLACEGDDSAHAFFYYNNLEVKAGVPYTFKLSGIAPDVDYEKIVLFIDLGRCRRGTAVSFTEFCLQETAGAASYGENLWGDNVALETWFSPGDWSGGLDPGASYSSGKLTLTVPDGVGGSEWQGQVKLTVPVAVSAAKDYDFACTIKADDDVVATVKLADANDDSNHAFFYDNNVALSADTPLVYKQSPTKPDQDYAATMLIFDFGRCPAGTAIEVTDIVLREIQ